MREAIAAAAAPVVAVSPFVAGDVVKGPTGEFMRAIGLEPSAAGVASAYDGLIDGLVVDAADDDGATMPDGLAVTRLDTLMAGAGGRRRVAAATLDFAGTLRG